MADPIHHLEIIVRKDVPDVLSLLQPDAVLPGHRPASVRAQLQDLVADPKDGFVLTGLEGVEQHEGMQVAVTRMKDVADIEAGTRADGSDPCDGCRQLRALYDARHDVDVSRQGA